MKTYKVTPLKVDQKLVKDVTKRRAAGENLATIAKALKTTSGRIAMAELLSVTKVVVITDHAALARAVAKERKAGKSWGLLSARYGVTEGTCRQAYTAATGQPYTALDYRHKPVAKQEAPKPKQAAKIGVPYDRKIAVKNARAKAAKDAELVAASAANKEALDTLLV